MSTNLYLNFYLNISGEIAAEILKRAGDDLAKVTDILEDDPSSPR